MSSHDGIPTPSDTSTPRDGGTDWPPDAFTRAVIGAAPSVAISTPAASSYVADSNMEAFDAQPPYALHGAGETNPARYTGAVGPAKPL